MRVVRVYEAYTCRPLFSSFDRYGFCQKRAVLVYHGERRRRVEDGTPIQQSANADARWFGRCVGIFHQNRHRAHRFAHL